MATTTNAAMATTTSTTMAMLFVPLLVAGMLATGTVNTILNKLQDLSCVADCDLPDPASRRYFEQPIWQTLNMFIGEFLCLVVYYAAQLAQSQSMPKQQPETQGYVRVSDGTPDAGSASHERRDASSHEQRQSLDTETTPLVNDLSADFESDSATIVVPARIPLVGWRNLLFVVPTVCDLTATTLMNVGLIYISASIYQMLRGSVVIFTGILSRFFLGHHHPLYRWFALFTVFLGVATVGLSGIVQSSGTALVPIKGSPVGIFLVVLAQIFTAFQFVVEEKIMMRYEVPALRAVGLEGLYGLVSVLVSMPLLHYSLGVRGPPGNYFDMVTGYHQVVYNPQVLWAGVGIIFSIATFNWFGLSVTRRISATTRSTIDTCRTLFIWVVSLALQWESFKWLQVVGFGILIYGTFLFNGVVRPPTFLREPEPEARVHEEIAHPHEEA